MIIGMVNMDSWQRDGFEFYANRSSKASFCVSYELYSYSKKIRILEVQSWKIPYSYLIQLSILSSNPLESSPVKQLSRLSVPYMYWQRNYIMCNPNHNTFVNKREHYEKLCWDNRQNLGIFCRKLSVWSPQILQTYSLSLVIHSIQNNSLKKFFFKVTGTHS